MSQYCDEAELRVYLSLDASTPSAVLADLITEVSDGFDAVLGFSYGGPARPVRLSGAAGTKLMLPRPGAVQVTKVTEDGIALGTADYELEPMHGRYLLRLSSDGTTSYWPYGDRNIALTYVPRRCPPALRQACKRESVKHWRARSMGFAQVIGTPGVSQLTYTDSFDTSTMALLDTLRWRAGSGGPGWVTM